MCISTDFDALCSPTTVEAGLYETALLDLREKGWEVGYGVHIDGVLEWDGKSNSFVQFVQKEGIAPAMDHGTYAYSLQFYGSNLYMNRMNTGNGIFCRYL